MPFSKCDQEPELDASHGVRERAVVETALVESKSRLSYW